MRDPRPRGFVQWGIAVVVLGTAGVVMLVSELIDGLQGVGDQVRYKIRGPGRGR